MPVTVVANAWQGGANDPQNVGNVTVAVGDQLAGFGWRYSGGDTISQFLVGSLALTARGGSTYAGNPYGAWTGVAAAAGSQSVDLDVGVGGSNMQGILLAIRGGTLNVASIVFADQAGGAGISLAIPSSPGDVCFVIGTDGFNGTTLTVTSSGGTDLVIDTPTANRFAIKQDAASSGGTTTITATAPGNQYRAMGFSVTPGTSSPNISSINLSAPTEGSGLTINGTTFGTSQGTKELRIGGNVQPIASWSDTKIVVPLVTMGANLFGGTTTIEIWETSPSASLVSNSFSAPGFQPSSEWTWVDIGAPDPTASNRITAAGDIAAGDQLAVQGWSGRVIPYSNGTFSYDAGVGSFLARVGTPGSGYGAAGLQVVRVIPGSLGQWHPELRSTAWW